MARPFLVFEDIAQTPKRRLFSFLGVEWMATRRAWIAPFFFFGLGLIVALLSEEGAPFRGVRWGLVYGLLLYLTNAIHTIGHVWGGWLVGSRMDANILTATRDVNVYRGAKREVTAATRVTRALGGPAANGVVGLACLAAWQLHGGGWLRMFGYFNLAIATWTLMPVPTLDGWVIWGSLVSRLRRR